MNSSSPSCQDLKHDVVTEWENGDETAKPLSVIAADDPVTSALHAKEHASLEQDDWMHFKCIAKW